MQEFISYTISGIMSLFAALIGVAYPLILQAAQRIDDKYHSTTLTQYVVNKPSFRMFRILMAIAIPVAIIAPFALYHCRNNEVHCYLILCLQSLLTCGQLLNFYYINYVIQKATIPPLFLNMLKAENKDSRRINEIFAFSKLYMIETSPELLNTAVGEVYTYIRDAGEPVVNSKEYNQILNSIVKLLEESDSRRQTIYCKSSDLWAVMLSPETKFGDEMRYTWIWKFIQASIFANNTDHIIRYWSWADQYAGSSAAQMELGENDAIKVDTFCHFNTMVCAALVYSKNWTTLSKVLYYSHIYPPTYDLMLNTFTDIIKELQFICSRDFDWLMKYSMRGMMGGVMMDAEIQQQAVRYIALSYLRLQSVNNYNITYSNPMSMPSMGEDISQCRKDLENAQWLLRNVQEWQKQPEVISACLGTHYDYSENANALLQQYMDALAVHIEELQRHPVVSQDKKQQFIDELRESIIYDKLGIPETEEIPSDFVLTYNKTRYEKIFPVKKSYLASGTDWLYFMPENMVKQINHDVRWTYYTRCFMPKPPVKSYSIGYHQIVKAIERLKLNSQYEVWVSGNFIAAYGLIDVNDAKMMLPTQDDNTWIYNGCEIHQFECQRSVAIVVKKGKMPVAHSRTFKYLDERGLKELEVKSHFYSNIENDAYPDFNDTQYGINLGRIVEFYAPREYEYVILNLTYPESEPSVLNEIENIATILETERNEK